METIDEEKTKFKLLFRRLQSQKELKKREDTINDFLLKNPILGQKIKENMGEGLLGLIKDPVYSKKIKKN